MGRYWNGAVPTPARPLNSGSGGTGQTAYSAGDILIAKADGKLYKRTVGTNGQVLTVDTTEDQKLKWATPDDGGAATPWTQIGSTVVADGSTRIVRLNVTGGYKHYAVVGEDMCMDGIGGYNHIMLWPNGDNSGTNTRCLMGVRAGNDNPTHKGNFVSFIWGASYTNSCRFVRSIGGAHVTAGQELVTSWSSVAALSYIDIAGEHVSTVLFGNLKLYGSNGIAPF